MYTRKYNEKEMLGRSIGNNDRSFSSPRSREGNELRSLAVEFSVDVVGIIISQLINVHIIISEDAGNGDGARRKGEGEGKREREKRGGWKCSCIGIVAAYASFSFAFD